jgi:hopanoid biosynthesis associated protein HpnK
VVVVRPGRRLIVTGDDFGLSSGVNAGIVRAYGEGILTSASLIVNGPATGEAVRLAHERPGLAVGLHLVLAQGRPTAAPHMVPDLVRADGTFSNWPVLSGIRYFFLPGMRTQLRREIEAQLERFRSFDLALSHVDGHLNMHLHPVVLDILIELAREYGIEAIRLTRDPLGQALWLDHRWPLRKVAEALVFAGLACWAEPRLRAAGIRYPGVLYGLHQTGAVDERYLLALLGWLPAGTAELYCHPGITPDPEVEQRMPGYRHDVELSALCSERVRASLYEHGVALGNYWQLREEEQGAGDSR